MTLNDLISKVRERLDEVGLNDSSFMQGEDQTVLNTLISGAVAEAMRYVMMNAQSGLVKANAIIKSGVQVTDASGVSYVRVTLNDSFLRLVWANMDGWLYPVNDLIHFSDSRYAMLKNVFTTGTWERPKVALVDSGSTTATKYLELYGPKPVATQAQVSDGGSGGSNMPDQKTVDVGVVNLPTVSTSDVGINSELEAALVYQVAGVVLLSYKDSQHAGEMFEMARALMGAVGRNENENANQNAN